jgi:hypothetical protein
MGASEGAWRAVGDGVKAEGGRGGRSHAAPSLAAATERGPGAPRRRPTAPRRHLPAPHRWGWGSCAPTASRAAPRGRAASPWGTAPGALRGCPRCGRARGRAAARGGPSPRRPRTCAARRGWCTAPRRRARRRRRRSRPPGARRGAAWDGAARHAARRAAAGSKGAARGRQARHGAATRGDAAECRRPHLEDLDDAPHGRAACGPRHQLPGAGRLWGVLPARRPCGGGGGAAARSPPDCSWRGSPLGARGGGRVRPPGRLLLARGRPRAGAGARGGRAQIAAGGRLGRRARLWRAAERGAHGKRRVRPPGPRHSRGVSRDRLPCAPGPARRPGGGAF